MARYVEGSDRQQVTLLPECLDDYIAEDNPVRVVEAYVSELDLEALGFEGMTPAATGRPAYHPSVLLKIYIYGYLNRIASSRRLERECQRNVELMWLTGRLAPDFKTIADFRRNSGAAIRRACRQFIVLCRDLKLFSQAVVAIDGSKFKAVNSRDRNFTPGKIDGRIRQIEESISRYLDALETADRTQAPDAEAKTDRLQEKIEGLRKRMRELEDLKADLAQREDPQISTTDPDARSMTSDGKTTGVVGYNVQAAVDTKHHLIVAHEVTNVGNDRGQLANMAGKAREAMGKAKFEAIADRVLQRASNQRLRGRGHRGVRAQANDLAEQGAQPLQQRRLHLHRTGRRIPVPSRGAAPLAANHAGKWPAHSHVLDQQVRSLCTSIKVHHGQGATRAALGARGRSRTGAGSSRPKPKQDDLRRRTIEHVFGTLEHWMGATHFLTRGLEHVSTEMSLQVLAYNLKRVISVIGITRTMKMMRLAGV